MCVHLFARAEIFLSWSSTANVKVMEYCNSGIICTRGIICNRDIICESKLCGEKLHIKSRVLLLQHVVYYIITFYETECPNLI